MFSRVPPGFRTQRRRGWSLIVAVLFLAYLLLTALGTLWTEFLWFDSLGYGSVWQTRWGMTILLGAAGVVVTFAVMWVNLVMVDRLSPRYAVFDLTEEEEIVERFREWVEPRARQLRLVAAAVLAVLLGLAAASWRDDVFLFLNTKVFGVPDPIFELDIGFYLFRFPLYRAVTGWLFTLLIFALVVAVVGHYFNGGIRIPGGRRISVSRGAKTHLLVLLAVLALVRAATYRLDALDLMFSERNRRPTGGFFGPGFTDEMARLPALRLLLAIALVGAVLFVVTIFRRGWTLAVVSVGAWLLVSLAAGVIYPAIVQRFQVEPQPLLRNAEYIANNIELTRLAYGFADVELRDFAASPLLTADDVEENRLTIDNVRLWDPSVLPQSYQNFQELRPYYRLDRVDTDRYDFDGEPTQVMVAVRELDEANLPRTDWLSQRLLYTHGFGAVMTQANSVESDGQPQFLLQDVPPRTELVELELEEPRSYFGESYGEGRPVIVKTGASPQEVDFPHPTQGTEVNEYDGLAGVDLSSFWRRVAFAFRYRDLNLLISGEIRPDSRVLVERNVKAMASQIAPFLEVDSDPYPVIVDKRVVWVIDMYTTSRWFPYSQRVGSEAVGRLPLSSRMSSDINYIRNSVKAVVDAYDGSIVFYHVDDTDPILSAWADAYPTLFRPFAEMPPAIVDHIRVPQDLFRLQGQVYLEYHVTDVGELFTGNDAWSLPADPSTIRRGQVTGTEYLRGDFTPTGEQQYRREMLPYYLLTRLPGEDDLSYLLIQPFNPRDKENMTAFLVADSTPGRFGRLVDFRMPQGELVDGTGQVGQRISQDENISEQFTLWDQQGSSVLRGDLLVVPVEDSVMYIQPVYLLGTDRGFPEFRRVIVVYGDRVRWAPTLDGALGLVFGDVEAPPPPPGGETIAELLDQAAAAFAAAEQALRNGDLAEYQRWVAEAERLITEARAVAAGETLEAAGSPSN